MIYLGNAETDSRNPQREPAKEATPGTVRRVEPEYHYTPRLRAVRRS